MRLRITQHAARRMGEWQMSSGAIERALSGGETIETYPDDAPYPSRLVLGWSGGRPLHVVAADVPATDDPDPTVWDPTFRVRRRP